MSRQLLPDEVWVKVEPLLPARSEEARTGRPPLPDRDALKGILFVLKTGIAWQQLPRELGCGCGMTCLRRLRDWQRAGVWDRVQEALARGLKQSHRIDWSRVRQDTGEGMAPRSVAM